jgi:hypothetical protein
VKQACKNTTSARRAREKMMGVKLPTRIKENQAIDDSESRALLQRITPYKVEVWE